MARQRNVFTLDQIESELGYTIHSLNDYSCEGSFYSNLSPVSSDAYTTAQTEIDTYAAQKLQGAALHHELVDLGRLPRVITMGGKTVDIQRKNNTGQHCFAVRVRHKSGFCLPLKLSESETSRLMMVKNFMVDNQYEPVSIFFRLPRELRDKIYGFCTSNGEWKIGDTSTFNSTTFPGAIGDPTGFFFPLATSTSVLQLSKQIRQEALPIAYRKTRFRLDDIDDFIKVAISIGEIGRANIESLEFSWESGQSVLLLQQQQHQIEEDKSSSDIIDDNSSKLPSLHVLRGIQLLKECSRLKNLRIWLENELVSRTSFVDLQKDPGIRGLSSIRGIKRVEINILNIPCEPLGQYEIVKWLRTKMESTDDEIR